MTVNGLKSSAARFTKSIPRRRYIAPVMLGAVLAPLVALGFTLEGRPTSIAASALCYSAQRVLSASDITYLGAIRMPAGTNTTFAYGGMTGRMVNGHVRLFVYGNHTGAVAGIADPVYEIEDPGGGYSTNYQTAPHATLITTWGDIYHGKRTSWDASGNQITLQYMYPSALYWNDATQLLYWTYLDTYNVSGRHDWGLGASTLDDPATGTTTAYGPWRTSSTDADGNAYYGPWRCLYPFANPDGSMMCGSTMQSGNVSAPWGPDAYGGHAWPTKTTPGGYGSPDLTMPSRFLEYYFMGSSQSSSYFDQNGALHGHFRSFRRTNEQALWEPMGNQTLRANPALNNGVGSWGELDGTGGAIWLDLTNTRGVIFSATLSGAVSQDPTDCANAAHEWYSSAGMHPPIGACSHGCPPPVGITGPVTTASFPAFIIYNPDDLLSVKAGAKNDYSVDPSSTIDVMRTYNVHTASQTTVGAARSLTGFYFDPVRKYLFAIAVQADDSAGPYAVQSLIHVFAINDTPPGS